MTHPRDRPPSSNERVSGASPEPRPVLDHESRIPDVEFVFANDLASPGMARRALWPLIADEGDPIASAVEIVTGALVTNVVRHTANGGTVRACDPKPNLPFHLEVTDRDLAPPTQRVAADETGGFGLRIVASLSDSWGVHWTAGGKTVWAEFDRRPTAG